MRHIRFSVFCFLFILALTGCNDMLYEGTAGGGDADGVGFGLYVSEQADMTIGVGQTRSEAAQEADKFMAHPVEGDNPYGLTVHRMPLPFVGIHKGAVAAGEPKDTGQMATRAHISSMVSSAENFHDSLTVWGYTQSGVTLFDKTLVQRVTNWRTSGHWPFDESGMMRFYAVAPSLENTNVLAANANYSTPPVLTYTLPEKAADMCDLLWGESGTIDIASLGSKAENLGEDNKIVDLQFQHILTAIRFAQGKIPADITIKKISIQGVYSKALFNPATVDATTGTQGSWSAWSIPLDYTMYANHTGSGGSTSPNTYVNDSVFYMLPHTLTETVTLAIDVHVSGEAADKTHTLKCSLTGDIWKKGYTVTYMLTIGEVENGYYFVAVQPADNEHSDVPTHHTFTVHSYQQYHDYDTDLDVTTHALNWKVVGYSSTEGGEFTMGNQPSWLTGSGVIGSATGTDKVYGGGYSSTASYDLDEQTATKGGNHATILTANSTARTDDTSWDLSIKNPDGTSKSEETANCYIVNRRGGYKFPLVYGNKTTDGAENACFVDHTGEVIKYSKIEDQIKSKNPAADTYEIIVADSKRKRTEYTWNSTIGSEPISLRAVLVWEDYNGLINTGGSYLTVADNYINFTIVPNSPGNAVIALQGRKVTKYEKNTGTTESPTWVLDTDAGTSGYDYGAWETFWTWHIWMTDEVYANEGKNNSFGSKKNDEMYLNWNGTNHLVSLKNWGTDGTDGTTATILPVNLGWVPNEMDFVYYSPREIYVKLQQLQSDGATPSGETAVVKIVQHANQPLVQGTGTFYQWGRPTALPGLNYTDDAKTVRTVYRNSSVFTDFTVENITDMKDVIANPTKLYRRIDLMTAWSTVERSTVESAAYWGDTKTVYDPCPPGFKVPNWNIFSGFSLIGGTAGKTETNRYQLNMWDEESGHNNYGGYFYIDPHTALEESNRYGQTVYMACTGQYQATKGAGSSMSSSVSPNNNFIETSPGTVWSNQFGSADSKGAALNLYPEWGRVNSSKPAIELPRDVNLSTACAIRPVQR